MRDEVIATNVLGAVESAKIAPPAFKNKIGATSFLGETLQFSSIFKATIDSPEKTLTNAQKPKETPEVRIDNRLNNLNDTSSKDDYSSLLNDKNSLDENINIGANSHLQDRDDLTSISSDIKGPNTQEIKPLTSKGDTTEATDNTDNSSINGFLAENDQNLRKNLPYLTQEVTSKNTNSTAADSQKPFSQDTTIIRPEILNANQMDKNKIIQTNSNSSFNSKVSAEIAGPIIRDTIQNKFNEEKPFRLPQNLKSSSTNGITNQNSNNLISVQENDLSNRLKADPFSTIKIQVNSGKNSISSNLSQNKTPIAQLTELSLNEINSSSKSGVLKFAPSTDTKNINPQLNNISNQSPTSIQTDTSTNIAPTLRQQTAIIGTQQSITNQSIMTPKVTAGSEIPNLTATASTGNSSPSQQTSRVAPPPPPPPPAKPPLPVEQVALQIKKAISAGIDKINIKLNPAHLGKVEVRMEIARDGQLSATVLADRPETLELLQRDIRGLERALQDGGLKTDSQSFNFSLKDQAQQQIADQNKNKNTQNTDTQEHEEQNDDQNQERMHDKYTGSYGSNLANNGGIDIRI